MNIRERILKKPDTTLRHDYDNSIWFECELLKLYGKEFASQCLQWLQGSDGVNHKFHEALFRFYDFKHEDQYYRYYVLYNILKELSDEYGTECAIELVNAKMLL